MRLSRGCPKYPGPSTIAGCVPSVIVYAVGGLITPKKGAARVCWLPLPVTAFCVSIDAGLLGDRTVYIGTFEAASLKASAKSLAQRPVLRPFAKTSAQREFGLSFA